MVSCYWCPSCNQWGQRFRDGCRKCRIGSFKHSKCGRIVTAQYGFCPICYPDRLERRLRPVKQKQSNKRVWSWSEQQMQAFRNKPRMPQGWTQTQTETYVFTKPTMPKGGTSDGPTLPKTLTQEELDVFYTPRDKPTMPKGWYDGKQVVRQVTSYIIKKDSENFTE